MVDLKEGEIVCDKCSGTGRTEVKRNSINFYASGMCPKCLGKGKLDWIENITGIKRFLFNFDAFPNIKPEFLKNILLKPSLELSKQEKQKKLLTSSWVFQKLDD